MPVNNYKAALEEMRAILRSGSHGDGTWNALSPAVRETLFEIADRALQSTPDSIGEVKAGKRDGQSHVGSAGQNVLPATGQPDEKPLDAIQTWAKWWKDNKPLLEYPNSGDAPTGFYAGWDARSKRESVAPEELGNFICPKYSCVFVSNEGGLKGLVNALTERFDIYERLPRRELVDEEGLAEALHGIDCAGSWSSAFACYQKYIDRAKMILEKFDLYRKASND